MRNVLTATIAAAALAVTVSAQDARPSGSLERDFHASGRVRMDLVAGEYHIVGTTGTKVRLAWSTRDAESLAKVRARADVTGNEMSITTDGPSNRSLRFDIQVPAQSDLYVRLSAGDLRIEDIRGNKDVELRAGDLRIDVGRAGDYKHVDASLWAGDIKASAFQIYKDGLFRSFDWSGGGPYRLHAHLMAGDLYLYSKADEARAR
jgi:hypothetical protein